MIKDGRVGWKPSKIEVFNERGELIDVSGTVKGASRKYFPQFEPTYLGVQLNKKSEYYSKKLKLTFIKHKNEGYLTPTSSYVAWYVFDKRQNKKYNVKSSVELRKILSINRRFYRQINQNGFYDDENFRIWKAAV